ncbi:MAG: DUF2809 domain-containing protein [Phormidium sp.]
MLLSPQRVDWACSLLGWNCMKFRTARQQRISRYRRYLAIAMVVSIALGIGSRVYTVPFAAWLQNPAGAIFYELFWMVLVAYIIPELAAGAIAIIIFVLTSLLELLQLYQHPILEAIRQTVVGRLLIGSSFDPWDFLHYCIGCMIGWVILRQLQRKVLTPKSYHRF